jgi:outer membrane lipoprotein-sorting protein
MTRTRQLLFRNLPIVLIAVLAGALGGPAGAAEDPWSHLERVRQRLVASGPVGADFVQDYLPAGFSSGERESGTMALALPDCLRWDYEIPYPKSFLLCGDTVYAWNPGEESGRRYQVDPAEEPGLDLLRLGVDGLKSRYEAEVVTAANGSVEVRLTPKASNGLLTEASLVFDEDEERPIALSYTDREGNRTRFQFSGYRPLGRTGDFTPPEELRWLAEPR